jgi:predicted metal-dependent phosphoesterase TrpH
MLIDLHVHSYLSAGCDLAPKAVLERAKTHGLDAVAFTETNTLDGCDELLELGAKSAVRVFVGLELVTDKGQYLCFFPKPETAPEPVQMWGSNREKPWSAAECLPKLQSMGAAIVAARPFDRNFPHFAGDFIQTLNCLNAVEGYNPKVRQSANDLAVEVAESMKLPCVAGSDAKASLDEIGLAGTLFKGDIKNHVQLVEALKGGQFWSVAMGELPALSRPGEARETERKASKKNRRGRGGRRWN